MPDGWVDQILHPRFHPDSLEPSPVLVRFASCRPISGLDFVGAWWLDPFPMQPGRIAGGVGMGIGQVPVLWSKTMGKRRVTVKILAMSWDAVAWRSWKAR